MPYAGLPDGAEVLPAGLPEGAVLLPDSTPEFRVGENSLAADPMNPTPQELQATDLARRRFLRTQGDWGTQAREMLRHPIDTLTGPTDPATSLTDFATRVLPESVGKFIPRTVSAVVHAGENILSPYYEGGKQILEGKPPLSTFAKSVYNSNMATADTIKNALKGVAGYVPYLSEPVTGETAAQHWLSDPASGAALLYGGAEGLKPFAKKASGLMPKETFSTVVNKGMEKGVRPSFEGNRTYSQSQQYSGKAQQAVKSIIDNHATGGLQLTDEFNEPVQGLPQNLKQFSQAIEQTKGHLFKQYNEMATKSGERGAEVDLSPIAKELNEIASNQVLNDSSPSVAAYARQRAEAYQNNKAVTDGVSTTPPKKTYTAEQAQQAITHFNQSLEAFYKNPSYDTASRAYIDSLIVNHLRKGLDSAIEQATGSGYQNLKNQYGALKSIEKDVNRRAIVDARKNNKGLLDFSDVFSGAEVVHGLLSMNPAAVGTGVAAKLIASLYKLKNDPNRIVKKMFAKASKKYEPQAPPTIKDFTPTAPTIAPDPMAGRVNTGDIVQPKGSTYYDATVGARRPAQNDPLQIRTPVRNMQQSSIPNITAAEALTAKQRVVQELTKTAPNTERAAQLEIMLDQYNKIIRGENTYKDFQPPPLNPERK